MDNEARLREDSIKGVRAFREYEEVRGALAAYKAECVKAWQDSNLRDTEGRERLWQAVKVIERVEMHLQKLINDGKIADRELAEIAMLGEKRKRFGIV